MNRKDKNQIDVSTPAIAQLEQLHIDFTAHQYRHSPDHMDQGYGIEAAQQLGIDPSRVYKTLMGDTGLERVIGIVPVSGHLNLKGLATALGLKRVRMADRSLAQKESGYILGGISPFGQKVRHRTVLDQGALQFQSILVSGGKRGLDIELDPRDLIQVLGALTAPIARL